MRSGRRNVVVGVLCGLTAVLMGGGVDAHGGDTSKIHACVQSGTGLVRVIGPGESCQIALETATDWSISGNKTVLTGASFPQTMGCIPCDGQARFLGPGINGMTTGLGVGNAGEAIISVPMPAGVLVDLRVQQTFGEGGTWSYGVWRNHVPDAIGCSIRAAQTSCTATGSIRFAAGETMSIGVGNPGSPFTFGGFYVKWSATFIAD